MQQLDSIIGVRRAISTKLEDIAIVQVDRFDEKAFLQDIHAYMRYLGHIPRVQQLDTAFDPVIYFNVVKTRISYLFEQVTEFVVTVGHHLC